MTIFDLVAGLLLLAAVLVLLFLILDRKPPTIDCAPLQQAVHTAKEPGYSAKTFKSPSELTEKIVFDIEIQEQESANDFLNTPLRSG